MKTTKELLLKLQELDTKLQDLQFQRGDVPEKIADLERKILEKSEYLNACEAAIENLKVDRANFAERLEENIQRLKMFEEKLYEVKNNKEYDQIQLEIETRKIEINELENKIFNSEEEEERLKEDIASVRKELEELMAEKAQRDEELKEIDSFVKEEEERLIQEKKEIINKLNPSFIQMYERIKKAKGGTAVAYITTNNACSGCYSLVPSQRIVEIRSKNQLFTCEYCGRILIWKEDEE